MGLDLSYTPGGTVEVVSRRPRKGGFCEAWVIDGSVGDHIPVDAYLPDTIDRIVVMAHGADNSRRARYIEVAAKVMGRHGSVIVAMDAPRHGDRSDAMPIEEPIGTLPGLAERAVRDHRLLLDNIERRWPGVPTGFCGFSMGGLHGVPLLAADARIRSGAIVVAGSTRVSYPMRFGELDQAALRALERTDPAVHAPAVTQPMLMLNAADDEIVAREAAWALYASFGGSRRLVFLPGSHTEWGQAAQWFRELDRFFVETLR